MSDPVHARRRAAQLARHYRDQQNLTIAEIAQRLGRAEATVKAYLDDRRTITTGLWIAGRKAVLGARWSCTDVNLQAPPRQWLRRHEAGVADNCPIRPGAEVSSVVIAVRGTAPSS
jgi:plasmid maintenance system antidote protein VapI